jgi:fused signal recognition particle receptor
MFGSSDDKKNSPPPAEQVSAGQQPSVPQQVKAEQPAPAPEKPAPEKKGMFGWMRKKPVEQPVTSAEPAAEVAPRPDAEPKTEPKAESVPETVQQSAEVLSAREAEPVAEVSPAVLPAEPAPPVEVPAPLPVEAPAAAPPSFSRFRINAGAEVSHAPTPVVVDVPPVVVEEVVAPAAAGETRPAETSKDGFFLRLKLALAKTSASLGEGMASLFLGKKAIDDDLLEEMETRLLTADVGVEATTQIVQSLTRRVARKELADSSALYKALQDELQQLLKPVEQPLQIDKAIQPYVILVVGVNGAGKTTTIGKLAKKLQLEGKKVMLAAGDTFRAAAVEQLQVWGERNQIPVIAQHTGADSASVIFDAVQAAKARGIDVLIADTAGRLHTKDNLMEELKKVRRVIGKLDQSAPHEVLLVLDAGTGQNAINQTKQFHQAVELTGLALTKLDGTAKGGVIFALAKQFSLPIRYIGVGEGIDDLRTFAADDFVKALFAARESS